MVGIDGVLHVLNVHCCELLCTTIKKGGHSTHAYYLLNWSLRLQRFILNTQNLIYPHLKVLRIK